ncbi:hypothetical protein L9F63_025738, partial [Diploptera punctata]
FYIMFGGLLANSNAFLVLVLRADGFKTGFYLKLLAYTQIFHNAGKSHSFLIMALLLHPFHRFNSSVTQALKLFLPVRAKLTWLLRDRMYSLLLHPFHRFSSSATLTLKPFHSALLNARRENNRKPVLMQYGVLESSIDAWSLVYFIVMSYSFPAAVMALKFHFVPVPLSQKQPLRFWLIPHNVIQEALVEFLSK